MQVLETCELAAYLAKIQFAYAIQKVKILTSARIVVKESMSGENLENIN